MNIFEGRIAGTYRNTPDQTNAEADSKNRYVMINKFQDAHMGIAPGVETCPDNNRWFYFQIFQHERKRKQ